MLNHYKKAFFGVLIIAVAAVGGYYLRLAFEGSIGVQAGYPIGPLTMRFYSLTLLGGVLAGYLVARLRRQEYGIRQEDLDNLVVVCVIAGLVGARVHHVLTQWDFYKQQPELIVYIWQGGLGIYGGIAAGIIATFAYTRWRRISFLQVAELLAPSLALGQAIGRWGNFFNQEAYGLPTQLPWKLFIDSQHRLQQFAESSFFHPLFLYESLWNLAVFVILFKVLRSNAGRGSIFGWYLILYSLGRYLIEGLRADVTLVAGYPLNQLLALLAMLIGVGIIFISRRKLVGLSG